MKMETRKRRQKKYQSAKTEDLQLALTMSRPSSRKSKPKKRKKKGQQKTKEKGKRKLGNSELFETNN